MTATMVSGGTESTLDSVDEGCTSNNSTPPESACYDSDEILMNATSLKLVGLAEDDGPDGAVRSAIISGDGELFIVKVGDSVTARYVVTTIGADVVELTDVTDHTIRRLPLR